jgi:hypothetical protein
MQPDMTLTCDGALARIKQKLDIAAGSSHVQQNVKRHYEHLETLAASLRRLGMDEREISDEIMQVFQRYERILNDYVQAA